MTGFVRRYRSLILLVAAWVAISIGGSVVSGLIIKAGIDAQQHRLDIAGKRLFNGQVAACVRADIQAAKDNKSQYADWKFDRTFVALVRANPQPRQTAKQKAQTRQFLQPLVGSIAAKAWVPLIQNCTVTVKRHGSNFVLPQPVPFNRHLPPRSALTLPPPPPLSPPASTHAQ